MKKVHAIGRTAPIVTSEYTVYCIVWRILKVCTESVIDLLGGLVDALLAEILVHTERVRSFSRKCKSLDDICENFRIN